jgi:hypothetical protein
LDEPVATAKPARVRDSPRAPSRAPVTVDELGLDLAPGHGLVAAARSPVAVVSDLDKD